MYAPPNHALISPATRDHLDRLSPCRTSDRDSTPGSRGTRKLDGAAKLTCNGQPAEVPSACASEEAAARQELALALDGVFSDSQANLPTQHTDWPPDDSSCRLIIICGKSRRRRFLRVLLSAECGEIGSLPSQCQHTYGPAAHGPGPNAVRPYSCLRAAPSGLMC